MLRVMDDAKNPAKVPASPVSQPPFALFVVCVHVGCVAGCVVVYRGFRRRVPAACHRHPRWGSSSDEGLVDAKAVGEASAYPVDAE